MYFDVMFPGLPNAVYRPAIRWDDLRAGQADRRIFKSDLPTLSRVS